MKPTKKDAMLRIELYLKEEGLIEEEHTVVNFFFRPEGMEILVDTEVPYKWYTVYNIQESDLIKWYKEEGIKYGVFTMDNLIPNGNYLV